MNQLESLRAAVQDAMRDGTDGTSNAAISLVARGMASRSRMILSRTQIILNRRMTQPPIDDLLVFVDPSEFDNYDLPGAPSKHKAILFADWSIRLGLYLLFFDDGGFQGIFYCVSGQSFSEAIEISKTFSEFVEYLARIADNPHWPP